MRGASGGKLTDTDSTAAARRHGFDWPHLLVELAIVVVGILIALAVNNWAQARRDTTLEARYLDRLLADSAENLTTLQERIDLNSRRADTLAHLGIWLTNGSEPPTADEISDVLCRWFMEPALHLRRETYAELVGTGNLALLRDLSLRGLLQQAEARHEESLRLDRFLDTLQRVAEPLNQYRHWKIDRNSKAGVGCDFDLEGMQSNPTISSILAQLYRDQTLHRSFREQELAAVRAVHDRIIKLRSAR